MLINVKGVKGFALEYAKKNRAHTFTCVSKDFTESIEFQVRDIIRKRVDSLPSKGRTI